MGDQRINIGDTVMIVKPSVCCGDISEVMKVFVAASGEMFGDGFCSKCGKTSGRVLGVLHSNNVGYLRSRLIKLPPLSEPTAIETTEATCDRA